MEIKQPKKKMGRPTVYTKAMTNAQRQKRFRDKQKQLKQDLDLNLNLNQI